LGVPNGVGVGTCNNICRAVIDNHLNYKNIFYQALPLGVFSARLLNALNAARNICAQIANWQPDDSLQNRSEQLNAIVNNSLNPANVLIWQNYVATLPEEITLQELRDFIWSNNDEQQAAILETVFARIGQEVPAAQVLPPRVRIMTMHGAKGLSARVVFVPGLEDSILPGQRRAPYPGLVLEAARLLYVSITRARAACIVSYASRRFVNGQMQNQVPSRFTAHLNGQFVFRPSGLQANEVQTILGSINEL